jgi:hypothetical protein
MASEKGRPIRRKREIYIQTEKKKDTRTKRERMIERK